MLIMAFFTILFGIMPWIGLDMMDDWTKQIFDGLIIFGKGGA